MTPVSYGWTIFEYPLAIILPCAVATISIQPKPAHDTPAVNTARIVHRMDRPIGEGGACWISSTAGKNSVSRLEGGEPSRPLDSACQAALKTVQCRPNISTPQLAFADVIRHTSIVE